MKKLFVVLAALAGVPLSLPAYGQMGMMHGGGMMNMSPRRYFVMQNGIDPAYAAKVNPLQNSAGNLAEGKRLYEQNCAQCHGVTGRGDGAAGQLLNPPPANISASSKTYMTTDGYLYWAIAEGGVPLGTAMPPFKGALTQDEIWKLIAYLRQL